MRLLRSHTGNAAKNATQLSLPVEIEPTLLSVEEGVSCDELK